MGAADDGRKAIAERAEGEVNDTDARLWHPWLRINRVLRVMLHTRWNAEQWSVVRVESQAGARVARDQRG